MNEQILNNLTTIEAEVISSRRKFLKNILGGSVLALSGIGAAGAAAKHIAHATPHKAGKSKANTKHEPAHNAKLKDSGKHKHESMHTVRQKEINNHKHEIVNNAKHKEINRHKHELVHNTDRNEFKHRKHDVIQTAEHEPGFSRKHDVFQLNRHKEYSERELVQDSYFNEDNEIFSRKYNVIQRPTYNRFSNLTHKALALENINTGEKVKLTYFERDRYLDDALDEINYLFRDHLTDEIHHVDTALLDQLHELQLTLGINKPYHVVCGYRSPNTNAQLRRQSHGVAKHSFHMEGRAVDLRIAGLSTREIRSAALSLGRGGVGYYPGHNFVHLDTGPIRTW